MAEWSELLAELVEARGTELNRYGFLLCGDRGEGADLLQDALVRVFTHPRGGWTVRDVEGYVRRTMLNRYLDLYRRQQRLRLLLPRLGHAQPESVPDHGEGADRRLDLLAALDALTPRQRACVVLRFYEDLPVAEVAHRMRLSQGTVKRHLSDANSRMSAALDSPEQVRTVRVAHMGGNR
ncbi:sigma-70 family RNA polymerase sigma factor [Streptacidiphilus neutrinimicus]|uniref:sigma-70 family RNA polymerase sigma factor n=1 Tax=Streptacidiphilus neutrinimicus TaxID=105420 RepID=UPI0005A74419|nr:sigma-70 family RNA polymerase sigma factor [Streptacidiphilus neutrinimicus]